MSKYSVEIHLDPETATTLYAEQANLIADLGPGGCVYVSTDSGASWTLNPVDASQGQYDVVLGLAAVSSKTADGSQPAISNVVNAACPLREAAAVRTFITPVGNTSNLLFF
jgi:hypothetical protein